jgi:sugar phosphate isomerase/epimerase
MKEQIVLSSGSLYHYGLNRFFEIAKKAGFDSIELCLDSRIDNQDPTYVKKTIKTI